MAGLLSKIENSFKAALRGEENINVLIYYWAMIAYLVAFLLNKLLKLVNVYFFSAAISVSLIFYFIGHIYVLKKCSPKKPKLTKEEKQKLREERRKELPKKIMRKLLLQESITKWDPIFVTMVVDAFCIAHFLDLILR